MLLVQQDCIKAIVGWELYSKDSKLTKGMTSNLNDDTLQRVVNIILSTVK